MNIQQLQSRVRLPDGYHAMNELERLAALRSSIRAADMENKIAASIVKEVECEKPQTALSENPHKASSYFKVMEYLASVSGATSYVVASSGLCSLKTARTVLARGVKAGRVSVNSPQKLDSRHHPKKYTLTSKGIDYVMNAEGQRKGRSPAAAEARKRTMLVMDRQDTFTSHDAATAKINSTRIAAACRTLCADGRLVIHGLVKSDTGSTLTVYRKV